jgi:putative ABC transport system permease protein
MTRVYLRLAFAGLRRRGVQAALTVVVVAAATAALTVALGVGRVADRPFDRTFAESNGAHVVARTFAGSDADLTLLERQPGVTASTGVVETAFTSLAHDGGTFGLQLVGVEAMPPEVSRPLVVQGSWPRPGQVLLERSFARFLGLEPGERLAAAGGRASLEISGIAVVPKGEAYPSSQPGIAFVGEETLAGLPAPAAGRGRLLGVRLADPATADAFAAGARRLLGLHATVEPWTQERAEAAETTHTIGVIFGFYAVFLLVAGGAVLATLVGGRVAAQARDVGLLKTAGLTPRQVGIVFLVEQLAVGALGCALGLLVGRLATPWFTGRAASLVNASETPPLDPARTGLVVVAVLALVAVFTLVPAVAAGRRPAAVVLRDGQQAHGGRSRLGRLADRLRLPLPAVLGARSSFARPGRSALTALSLALTVAAVVATLGMEASLDVATSPPPAPPLAQGLDTPAWDPVDDDAGEGATLRPIVYGLDALLLFVALVNLLATLLLAVRERVREVGLLKAIGLTPRQVSGTVVWSQALLGAAAALGGIPLGLAFFRLAIGLTGGSDEFAYPAAWAVALLAPAAVLAVVALTAPLARRAAAIRVTEALRYE